MKYYEPLKYTVADNEDGWLLRTVMRNKMGVSRRLMSKLKRAEQGIIVNGERAFVNRKMTAGDQIMLYMEVESSVSYIEPEQMSLNIIFEDEALLVVNKPAGLIVHPTHGHYTGTLANGIVHYWEEKGEQYRFRPMHRLDEHTSGIVMIAKNPYVHHQVSEQMRKNRILKQYIAVVHGRPPHNKATIDAPIDRDPDDRAIRKVICSGARAITHYELERQYANHSVLRVQLETGRTHQIRVHLAYLGCPLIGEPVYMTEKYRAAASNRLMNRQALHAARVVLKHPNTGKELELNAPPPEDIKQLLDNLDELTINGVND